MAEISLDSYTVGKCSVPNTLAIATGSTGTDGEYKYGQESRKEGPSFHTYALFAVKTDGYYFYCKALK